MSWPMHSFSFGPIVSLGVWLWYMNLKDTPGGYCHLQLVHILAYI